MKIVTDISDSVIFAAVITISPNMNIRYECDRAKIGAILLVLHKQFHFT